MVKSYNPNQKIKHNELNFGAEDTTNFVKNSGLMEYEKSAIKGLLNKSKDLAADRPQVADLINAHSESLKQVLTMQELGDVRALQYHFQKIVKAIYNDEETTDENRYLLMSFANLDAKFVETLESEMNTTIENAKTSDKRILEINIKGHKVKVSFGKLCREIAHRYFRSVAPILGRKYLSFRKKYSHSESKKMILEQESKKLSSIPAEGKCFDLKLIRQIEDVIGSIENWSSGDDTTFKVSHNNVDYEDCCQNLFARLSSKFELGGVSKSREYLILRKNGEVHKEAMRKVQQTKTSRVSNNEKKRIPIDPESLSTSFIKKLAFYFPRPLEDISGADTTKIKINIEGEEYFDSPSSILDRIAQRIFNSRSKPLAREYLIARRKGMNHEQSITVSAAQKKCDPMITEEPKIMVPITPDSFTQSTIEHIEKAFNQSIDLIPIKDSNNFEVTINGKLYVEKMHNMLRKIAFAFFSSRDAIPQARKYLILRRSGKTHEEAKQIMGIGEEKCTYWTEQIRMSKSREAFLTLFTHHRIPEEIWRDARKLRAAHVLLSNAIRNQFPHEIFIAYMDDRLPFHEFTSKQEAHKYLDKEIIRLRATGKWIKNAEKSDEITREEYMEIAKLEYYDTNIVVKVITDYLDPRTKQ